jgi:hypothetical protein
LYAAESSSGTSYITVLDGQTGQLLGRVPDASIQGLSSDIEDADETQLLFGMSNRGISFVDASTPGTISAAAPSFASAPSAQPSEGPITGGTSIILNGQNFVSPVQLKFGSQMAAGASVSGTTQILANSPSSALNDAVNLTAYFQNSWLALAPDAFSYGPQVLQIFPSAGTPAGGDSIQIYGYGFGNDPARINVRIGGANAAAQTVENLTSLSPSLGLDSSYPFPLERITLQTPPGTSGRADLLVTVPSGSVTSPKAFQYLQSVHSYSKPGSTNS